MTGARDHRAVAQGLNDALADATPNEVIESALSSVAIGRLAVASSFGTESAVLLKYVADVDASIPVLFLDTGWLFEETIAYRDTLVARLGLKDLRILRPAREKIAARDPDRDLWFRDTDACCHLRKIEPLRDALSQFEGWINGRKRFHGDDRARIPVVETDGPRLKFNPLAAVSRDDIQGAFEAMNLPRHPLEQLGFASIGCMPCTSKARTHQSVRDGRWQGKAKTECGIHVPDRT